jgi:amino acid permease
MGSDAGALEAPLLLVVDTAAPAAPRPSSHGGAVANLVATAVGAGLLALPKTLVAVGALPGLAVVLAAGGATYLSAAVVLRAAAAGGHRTYAELIEAEYGCAGAAALQAGVLVHVVGVMVVYLVVIADALCGAAPAYAGLLPTLLGAAGAPPPWWLSHGAVTGALVAAAALPMLAARSLVAVARFSRVAVILVLLLAAALVALAGDALARGAAAPSRAALPPPGAGFSALAAALLEALAVCALAYCIHMNVVPVHLSLQAASAAPALRATRDATAICAFLYAAVAAAGYTIFGDKVSGDVLADLSITRVSALAGPRLAAPLVAFFAAAMTAALLVNFVLKAWAAREGAAEAALGRRGAAALAGPAWFLSGALLALFAWAAALVLPDVYALSSLIGATACAVFTYAFPGLLAIRGGGAAGGAAGAAALALAATMAASGVRSALGGGGGA